MDDVKKYLAILQKHHFWVLAALLVIVGPLCWRAGASYLSEQAATNQATVDGKFSAAAGISGNPPNPSFAAEVDKMTDELKQQVLAAWEELYREQKGLFKWPQAVESIGLLKLDEEIPQDLRIRYQNAVLEPEWQRVLLTVNYRREKPIAAVAPAAPGALFGQPVVEPEIQYEGVVQWDESAREALVARYRKTEVMTTLDIRVAQEDMWIYESLLKIIAKVNEGATEPHAAVIKRIDLLETGSFAMNVAIGAPGTYTTVAAAVTAAPTDGSEEEYYEPTPTYTAPTFTPTTAGSNPVLSGRYLGASGEPIDATAPQPFAEFKQVFVDMRFAMDQRKVPELLAVCVNAPLPVEIRQVRIQSLGSVAEPTSEAGTAAVLGPQDASVEVRGVIYMYNEPSADKIGMGAAGAPPTQRPFGIPGTLY